MDYSLPGSSVHGISQARKLGAVAISSSRGASWFRGRTHVSCTGSFFTAEPPGKTALWIWRTPNAAGIGGEARFHLYLLDLPSSRCHWVWDSSENLRWEWVFLSQKIQKQHKEILGLYHLGCHGGRQTMHPLFLLGKAGCSHPPPSAAVSGLICPLFAWSGGPRHPQDEHDRQEPVIINPIPL